MPIWKVHIAHMFFAADFSIIVPPLCKDISGDTKVEKYTDRLYR